MEKKYLLWSIAIVVAFIPIFTWIYFLIRKDEKRKGVIFAMFFFGILTVAPLLLFQYSWKLFPQLNVFTVIPGKISNIIISSILIIAILAFMEEVFKQWLVRFADKKWLLVKSVNDSIRLSIVAALGFSFAENVYPYFFQLLGSGDYKGLIGAYFFRSLFTAGAHIFFSGIFGYYYGIGKFVTNYRDEAKWKGKKLYIARFICKIFRMPQDQAYREEKILQGLLYAGIFHSVYNSFMQYNMIIPALVVVLIGFSYLMVLLKRASGQLNLVTDISMRQESKFQKKDEEVIFELIGQWMKEKKYSDVMNACNRLLQKDPENNTVKLFKTKAQDAIQGIDIYHEATEIIGTRKQVEDKSTIGIESVKIKKPGQNLPQNFQDSEKYGKFLEEEKKKKEADPTYKLDISPGGPGI